MLHTMKLTVNSISYHEYLHEELLVCVHVGGGGGGCAKVAAPSIIRSRGFIQKFWVAMVLHGSLIVC